MVFSFVESRKSEMNAIFMINSMDIRSAVVVGKTETHLSRYSNLHYKCIIIYKSSVC